MKRVVAEVVLLHKHGEQALTKSLLAVLKLHGQGVLRGRLERGALQLQPRRPALVENAMHLGDDIVFVCNLLLQASEL